MPLRRKIQIYTGITTLCLLALLYFSWQRTLMHNYERMELDSSRETMKQNLLAFFDEYTNLDAITINYAVWDESYRFAAKPDVPAPDDPYITINYADSLYTSSRLNVTLLLNTRKQVYFAKAYDYAADRPMDYPNSVIRSLLTDHPSFLEHAEASSRKQGLLIVDGKPMIAASFPVLSSNNAGPVHGTIVFGRFLDDHYIRYISGKTDMPIAISAVEPGFAPPHTAAVIAGPGNRTLPFWNELGETKVTGYSLIKDFYDNPALVLKYEQPRELYREARKNLMFYLIYFALSGLLFVVVIDFLLQKTIFARLNETVGGMNAVEAKKDFSIRIPVSGKDEFTQLEQSFNHMMESLEQAQNEIRHQADHDTLTGLSNRKSFYAYLEKTIRTSGRPPYSRLAVMFIDLDRFKLINDTMGHHTGDLLLLEAARRLRRCLKKGDFLSRLGGDEFCVVTHDAFDVSRIEQLAGAIREALAAPFELDGCRFSISASVGISLYPDHGADLESLLRHSDTAMLDVKENGKNNYGWYSESIEANRTRRLLIERFLKTAALNDELSLNFQPKLDLARNRIAGAEALLRWTNPQLGVVSPAEFIPIAESSGIINDIGDWIIRTACRQFVAWQREMADVPLIVAVNISGVQLLQPHFVERIEKVFADERVDPSHFELEVTESFAIAKFEEVIDIFVQLRKLGFTISIDDFGAGYSSMRYLFRLPVQCMKIDKTLIDQLGHNVRSQVVVSGLIEMAHRLQLAVVAEGVELPEQLDVLREYRCDQVQGYLIGKPVTGDGIVEMLRARR